MSAKPLHIVRPLFPRLDSFADEFQSALLSGAVTNHGPHVRDLEQRLATYMNVPATLCTTNGQSALLLMLRAAGIDGGEVITSAYTFSATPHAVRWCGARPVFAEIDARTMCLDPADVESRITSETRAILAVDVYGIACDYDAFEAIGKRHGIKVLYDSAPAFGTRVRQHPIGGHGDAQCFSFHATKAFCTMEGGCLTSRDEDLLERARALRNFGQSDGADCDEPGINAKMTEVCALIGLRQLEGFDQIVEHRAHIADRFRAGLADTPGLTLAQPAEHQTPVWLYFPVVVDPDRFGIDRNQLARALEAENLHVRKYFELPCHHIKAYRGNRSQSLPTTEQIAYRVLALPVYNDMTEAECDLFIEGIRRAHRHAAMLATHVADIG